MPPILVLNSMGFTEWSVHFERLTKVIDEAHGTFMTVIGIGRESGVSSSLFWAIFF